MKIAILILFGLAGLGLHIQTVHAQGSLTPPAPPGPTMLTLSQVEPRSPVDAIHTPGNGTMEFAITNAGSYYLTTNLFGVSGEGGIGIYTNNVTLDLNGFSLQGASVGNIGIQAFGGTTNVIVQNGLISGWYSDGVYCVAYDSILQNLSAAGNGNGLAIANVCEIKNCTASDNQLNGIAVVASGCLVSGNVCNENNQANINTDGGIVVLGANNRIENNQLAGNTGYGIEIEAILGATNNIVVGNSVQGDGANDYFYSTAQIVGPIMTNNATGIITNSNPWANFQF
jgi:parallel beta-helix repeat protein